ncbi:hypothetical protein BJV82DRAFT_607199 [Fennellomyces sp. T-0311]|nr:hypothetical protein BJV82DRAFT_607199 [Fennellomyces sp. T-0311]
MTEKVFQQYETWRVELTKSNNALSTGNYQDAAQSAGSGLDHLMNTHVLELLNIRATAYEKQGLLSRALDDAMRMIQYVPNSPVGYLRAGNIQMVNGKPKLAMKVYAQGIRALPSEHPDSDKLMAEQRKAILRANSRFDIVGQLPRELLYKILVYLDPERVWVCLKVSRRWCEQVSQCGTWWSAVTVKQTGAATDNAVCDAIPLVNDYIQHLELASPSSVLLNCRYLAYLKNGIFTRLKTLLLKGSFFQTVSSEDLAIALWQVRNTLTVLKLEFDSDKIFPLRTVLEACPNVRELVYTSAGDISSGTNNGHSFAVQCNKLVNLELNYVHSTYTSICASLVLCSNLRRLIITTPSFQPLGTADRYSFTKYCPRLKVLGLNSTDGLPSLAEMKCSPEDRGVGYMAIRFDRHFTFQQSAAHIEAQSQTLQHLSINFTQQDEPNLAFVPRISRAYPKLTTLRYKSDQVVLSFGTTAAARESLRSETESFVAHVIQSSPDLKDIAFTSGVRGAFPSIRNALEMAVKRNVQTLTLSLAYFDDTTEDRYKNLLSSLATVRSLTMQSCGFLTDKVLVSLAESESIQSLKLVGCALVTKPGLSEFLRQITLRRSHQLHTLELNKSLVSIDQTVSRLLVKISGLSTLRITSRYDITSSTIDELIDLSCGSSLKTIELVNCVPVSVVSSWQNTVKRAKERGVTLKFE